VTLVVDASVVAAALIDTGADGIWADRTLGSESLVGPHLLPVEVANVLRRAALAGDISVDSASLAHRDLLKLRIDLFAYEPFAARVWALHDRMSTYDGWYVALAEALDAPLATLDGRLARSGSGRCRFVMPGFSARPPRRGRR
jgi:predicted nucleic acid-binding protein